MRVMYHLSKDDIRKELPYAVICEARYGCRWDTGRRKRMWMQEFTPEERKKSSDIFNRAHRMYLTSGIPDDGIVMHPSTYYLWKKLGDFCASL